MNTVDPNDVRKLREMARRGASVAAMYRQLKGRLGSGAHILYILNCFRDAFSMSLAEAKPLVAFTRTADREIDDEDTLNRLVMLEIEKHRNDWDT